MKKQNAKVVVITGATSGLGFALAERFSARGARVISVGRRAIADLDSTGSWLRDGNYCQTDLSRPAASSVLQRFLADRGVRQIEMLVNNAAAPQIEAVAEIRLATAQALTQLNLLTPMEITRRLLPMMAPKTGRVVFVGSAAAALPCPDYAVYAATKAALAAFARNLRAELAGELVVNVVHPGAMATNFFADPGGERLGIDPTGFPAPGPVADSIVRRLLHLKRDAIVGTRNRLVWCAGQTWPSYCERLRWPRLDGFTSVPPPGAPPVALVTGAADGLGKALAHRLVRAGYRVVAVDCDADRGRQLLAELRAAGAYATFYCADLADAAALDRLIADLADGSPFDLVVQNAGINRFGPFRQSTPEINERLVAVNLLAPMALTAGLLRGGRLANGGAVVLVSSLSQFVGYPGAAVYAASKAGLTSFGRSLAAALRPRGGRVLTVFPGPTRTRQAHENSPDHSRAARRMSPEDLADRIVLALRKRRRWLIPGFKNSVAACCGWWFPETTTALMKAAMTAPHDAGRGQRRDA